MTELKLPTKPAPPPPRFRGGMKVLPPRLDVGNDRFRQLEHYKLPMRDEYLPAWKAVLQECGYPTDVVVLDFETYFDDTYKMAGKGEGLSTVEYIADSRFEVLGLGMLMVYRDENFPDYEEQTHFFAGEEAAQYLAWPKDKYGPNLERCTVVAQNAKFDVMILAMRYGIRPPFVIDILALARAWNSRTKNDLGSLSKRFKLPEKGDTAEFKGLTFRKRFAKPKGRKKGPKMPVQVPVITEYQVAALAAYGRNDVMREWELFTLLLPKLSRPKVELRVMQHTLDMYWRPTLQVDHAKGEELKAAMAAEIDAAVAKVEYPGLDADSQRTWVKATREEISGDTRFEQLLMMALNDAGDNPARFYKQGKREMILAIAKDDPERAKLETHSSERVRNLMAARAATASWPLHIARVDRIMAQAKAGGGNLPVPLNYHGAHTGRDSGGEKINLQNLGSRGHELVNAVRELIIAPAGQSLVIVDEKAVEAVGLAWIAGEWGLVEKFNHNEEIYCGFAAKVLGKPVRKPKKTGIPEVEEWHKWARNSIGKIGVLGCGYGMGTNRIFEYANGAIDFKTADKIKEVYRAEHPAIVQFWKDIERAFIYTARYGRPCEMPRGLRFHQLPDCDVVLTLPNGRELHYHKVKLASDAYGEKIEVWNDLEHHWGHVWGGHLTENVVQAFCRDFLMEACLRLEAMGHHTALRVHDELVMVVPDDQAEAVLKVAVAELSRRPEWASDCPLGAEGVIAKRYGGH
jgi:DNA polymerase III epsilon subunit-like protein